MKNNQIVVKTLHATLNAETCCVISLWLSHCHKRNLMSVQDLLRFGPHQQAMRMEVVDEETGLGE